MSSPYKIHPSRVEGTFVLFTLLIVFAITTVVFGTLLALGQQTLTIPSLSSATAQKKEVKPVEKKAAMTKWTNKAQGYELSYPTGWTVFPDSMGAAVGSFSGTILSTIKTSKSLSEASAPDEGRVIISIVEDQKSNALSLRQYIQSSSLLDAESKQLLVSEKLGEYDALAFSRSANVVTFFIDRDNFIYSLETISTNTAQKADIQKILTSFHFISVQSVDISKWKEFLHEDVGYSISYPQDFKARDRATSLVITDGDDTPYIEIGATQYDESLFCTNTTPFTDPVATIKTIVNYIDCDDYYYALIVPKKASEGAKIQLPVKFYTGDDVDRQILKSIASTLRF